MASQSTAMTDDQAPASIMDQSSSSIISEPADLKYWSQFCEGIQQKTLEVNGALEPGEIPSSELQKEQSDPDSAPNQLVKHQVLPTESGVSATRNNIPL
jgi:hypothetical protein